MADRPATEPDVRVDQLLALRLRTRREGGEIAVGEREHDQIGRVLTEIDGQPMTTSRKVTARFKKAHKNVLQSIKRIEVQQPE